jgi:uncharacterized membrane protein
MSIVAIAGLLFAAALHAVWNLLAKRGLDNQVFLICAVVVSTALLLPLAVARWTPIAPAAWVIMLLSAAFESGYYLLLGRAYKGGDLSLVYPISRGSSPLFVTLIAMIVLGERIAPIGGLGIALTVIGIYVLHLRSFDRVALLEPLHTLRDSRTSQIALLSGVTIAGYSVVDKVGVDHVDPVQYIFVVFLFSLVMLAPYMVLKRRAAVTREWRTNWRTLIAVGAMIGGGYLLILLILTTNKVSYATSVRGASVVFGALLGTVVLKEDLGDKKLIGSLIIFTGIICIGLAQ